jgi:hypothetical protein
MRGGGEPAGQEMVGLAGVGSADCQTVERKLAGILHRMWVNETDFHAGSVPRSRNDCD